LTDKLEPPRAHGLGDILEDLWTKVIAGNIDLAPDLPIGVVRHTDAARLGDTFKARRDIDAIAEDIAIVNYNIADVNADAEFDPLVLRHRSILLGHARLNVNGTTYRIHGASKFDQHAVTGRFDDAASMRSYGGINEGLSNSLKPGQRILLVGTHQAAIPSDIRRQHRCQSPVHALGGQRIISKTAIEPCALKHIRPLLD
jgi:hypothetical protein